MLIAIDFDDTLTRAPPLWKDFKADAEAMGHRVVCVTARRETLENVEIIDEWMADHNLRMPVYFSSLGSKVEYMKSIGRPVDIWIDDDPKSCALGH